MIKKIITTLIVLSIFVMQCQLTFASTNKNFESFRFNQNVVTTPTPWDQQNSEIVWQKDFTEGYDNLSNLIINDNYLYFISNTNRRLIKSDLLGNVILETQIDVPLISWNIFITLGDGMIFVSSANCIVAYDQNTLQKVWQSTEVTGSIEGPITYYDGYVYCGTRSSESSFYYGFQVNSDNYWQSVGGSFYWAQAVVYDEGILYGDTNGVLTYHDLKSDRIISQVTLDGGISSGVAIYNQNIYIASKAGTLYQLEIKQDQLQIKNTLTLSGVEVSSSSTIANQRLYIGSKAKGNFYAGGYIECVDLNTFKLIDSIKVEGNVQSSPLVSTAYQNKNIVYFTYNSLPGGIKVLVDDLNTQQLTISDLYTPQGDQAQYCVSSIISDQLGNLYHYNDSGYITKITNKTYTSPLDTITTNLPNISISGTFYPETIATLNKTQEQEIEDLLKQQNINLRQYESYQLQLSHPSLVVDTKQVKMNYTLNQNESLERLVIYKLINHQLTQINLPNTNSKSTTVQFEIPVDATIIIGQKTLRQTIECDDQLASITGDFDSDVRFKIEEITEKAILQNVEKMISKPIQNLHIYDLDLIKNQQTYTSTNKSTVYFELPFECNYNNLKLYQLINQQLIEVKYQYDGFGLTFDIEQMADLVMFEQVDLEKTNTNIDNNMNASNTADTVTVPQTSDSTQVTFYWILFVTCFMMCSLLKKGKQ